jgi:hypothetical protein
MFKGGTQGDGLHYSAVTLVSPIAEVNGQGFKFHSEEMGCLIEKKQDTRAKRKKYYRRNTIELNRKVLVK